MVAISGMSVDSQLLTLQTLHISAAAKGTELPPLTIKYVAKTDAGSDGIDSFNVPDFGSNTRVSIVAVDNWNKKQTADGSIVPVTAAAKFSLGNAKVEIYNFDFDKLARYTLQEAVYGTKATGEDGAVVPKDTYNDSYDIGLDPRLDLTAGEGYASTQAAKVTGALQGSEYNTFQNCVFTQLVNDLQRNGGSINTLQDIDPGTLAVGSPPLDLGVTAGGGYTSNPALDGARIASESGAEDKRLYYLSSDTAVATVDADGKVTAVAPGQAFIYVKAMDQYNQGELEKPYARFILTVPTSFTATKTWDNSPYTPKTLLDPPAEIPPVPAPDERVDIYFQLMVKVKGSGASPTPVGSPVLLPKTNDLITHTWSDLPATNAAGDELEYSAREYTKDSAGTFGWADIHNYITWQKAGDQIVNIFNPSLDGNQSTPCHLHWYLESLTDKTREIYVDSNHNFLYSVHAEGEGLGQIQHWRWTPITSAVAWRIPFAFSIPVKNLVIKMTLQEGWTLNPASYEITGASALYRHTGAVPELYTTIDRATVELVAFEDGNIEVHVKDVPAMTAFTLNFSGFHKDGSPEAYYLGLDVTGDYSCVSASKTWLGGESPYPTVQVQLMRQGEEDSTPQPMADAVEAFLNDRAGQQIWYKKNPISIPGNPGYDPDADPYLYSPTLLEILGSFPEEGRLIIGHLTLAADAAGTDPFLYEEALADTLVAELAEKAQARYTMDIEDPGDGTNKNGVGWNRLAFTDHNGKPVEYSVEETLPEGSTYIPLGDPVKTVDPANKEKVHFAFTNVNLVEATATKVWSGGPSPKPTVWFQLQRAIEGGTAAPVPDAEIKELADGTTSVTWTDLEETDKDGKPYTFTVKEVDAAGADFTPKDYAKTESGLTVTNAYTIPKATTIHINAMKDYKGADLVADAFTFELYDLTASKLLGTKKNAADGKIAFDPIAIEAAGDYQYRVKEIKGSADGVTYDGSIYTLSYKVEPDPANALQVKLTELKKDGTALDLGAELLFQNEYKAPEKPVDPPTPTYPVINVPLSVKKVLKNGSLKADTFTFLLKDKAGTVLSEVKNAADGSVHFPDRTFTKAGSNFIFTIQEVKGDDKKVVYDTTVYTVKITTKPGSGQLEATVNLEKDGVPYAGEMVFTNVLPAPATGDPILRTMGMLLGLALLLMGAAFVVKRKRAYNE
ncbi:MAG: Cna B-type domain-containing protein [Clostridiales bacterium]|nr:Cna B-type domain-containing protein [Clostridiales bacterium]